jgi:hypothetical protein
MTAVNAVLAVVLLQGHLSNPTEELVTFLRRFDPGPG